MVEDPETGKKKRKLVDYQYDLGDCMFCELCVNACNFGAIKFVNDFGECSLRPQQVGDAP